MTFPNKQDHRPGDNLVNTHNLRSLSRTVTISFKDSTELWEVTGQITLLGLLVNVSIRITPCTELHTHSLPCSQLTVGETMT